MLYKEDVYNSSTTATALLKIYPDILAPSEITDLGLFAFVNAALHCSTTVEVCVALNEVAENIKNKDKGV